MKSQSGHCLRFLPFEQNLFKGKENETPSSNSSFMSKSVTKSFQHSSTALFQNDPDVMENLPDNSHLHTNLFVKGLDLTLTAEDLHLIFASFGDIKSCKVA